MKKLLLLMMMVLVVACGGTETTTETPTEVPVVENTIAPTEAVEEPTEEAVAETITEEAAETVTEETVDVVSEQVEIVLLDVLDGNINNYCLDIAGGNQDVDPNNGLQAHTCYSYQGDLGTDQIFDTARFADNVLYMPVYDVCVQVTDVAAGADVGLATCDGSDLQSFVFGDSGTISPASATELCFTAGAESRSGRNADHQIRDLTLEACSDALAAYQQWGSRASLEDEISLLSGTAVATDEVVSEESETDEEPVTEGASGDTVATSSVSTLANCNTSNVLGQSTDADVEQLRAAIVAFRASLSEELLEAGSTCLSDERVYLWHNTPANDNRDGITYGDLSDEQLALFQDVLNAFLSDDGYQKVEEITFLSEGYLNTLRAELWSTDYYSIDMFGDPENTGSWGVQLDGHHAAINFFVHGDAVSIVPAFLGAEPMVGSLDGVEFDIFSAERDLAFALYAQLSDDELAAAVSDGEATMQVGPADRNGDPDPYIGDYDYSGFETGLQYSNMSETAQAGLTALMQVYVYNMETPFADVWWESIMTNIDDTSFVWIGDGDASASDYPVFYYRIYNPSLWVEYNIESNVGPGVEAGNHAHSITRVPSTLDGGDYSIFASAINGNGPSTLLEHYVMVDHHAYGLMQFDYELIGHSQD